MARRSKYKTLEDLDYSGTVKRFERTLDLHTDYLIDKFYDDGRHHFKNEDVSKVTDLDQFIDEMLFHAAGSGNLAIVKYLMEDYKVKPDPDFRHPTTAYTLSHCIRSGSGVDKSSFREVAIYLIDNGATPNIGDNSPLKAAKSSSIAMFAEESHFNSGKDQLKEHDIVVKRLLEEESVIQTIIDKNQEEFYPLIPDVIDLFIF